MTPDKSCASLPANETLRPGSDSCNQKDCKGDSDVDFQSPTKSKPPSRRVWQVVRLVDVHGARLQKQPKPCGDDSDPEEPCRPYWCQYSRNPMRKPLSPRWERYVCVHWQFLPLDCSVLEAVVRQTPIGDKYFINEVLKEPKTVNVSQVIMVRQYLHTCSTELWCWS